MTPQGRLDCVFGAIAVFAVVMFIWYLAVGVPAKKKHDLLRGLPNYIGSFEYKGHSYLQRDNGGLIHAQHCPCLTNQ